MCPDQAFPHAQSPVRSQLTPLHATLPGSQYRLLAGFKYSKLDKGSMSNTNTEAARKEAKRNLKFLRMVQELRGVLEDEYDENWGEVCDYQSGVAIKLQQNWEYKWRQKNETQFIAFLTQSYFCTGKKMYQEEVKIPDNDIAFLLPPQHRVVEEINQWDNEDFSDTDNRKTYLEEKVNNMIENPWDKNSIPEIAKEFKEYHE